MTILQTQNFKKIYGRSDEEPFIFTGYLIIYNIFQISVSEDIRFYGLLKTFLCLR